MSVSRQPLVCNSALRLIKSPFSPSLQALKWATHPALPHAFILYSAQKKPRFSKQSSSYLYRVLFFISTSSVRWITECLLLNRIVWKCPCLFIGAPTAWTGLTARDYRNLQGINIMTRGQAFEWYCADKVVTLNCFNNSQAASLSALPPCGVAAWERVKLTRSSSKAVPGGARRVLKGLGGVASSGHMVIITTGH